MSQAPPCVGHSVGHSLREWPWGTLFYLQLKWPGSLYGFNTQGLVVY